MITNLFVHTGDSKSDKDLIYMKNLNYALKKVVEWYFPPKDKGAPVKVLDVTAGERKIWNQTHLFNKNLNGKKLYDVTFFDCTVHAKADVVGDFRFLQSFEDNSFDFLVFDPPFIKPENGIEGFGIKTHHTPDRLFYFRQNQDWVPPEDFFAMTWQEFNRVSKNGLIVKISERYEDGYEVPVTTYMDICYDNRLNPLSQFKRCVKVGYRGKRAGMGAKMIHAQRVLTYYAVYKKDFRLERAQPKKTEAQKKAIRDEKARRPKQTFF